MKQAQHLRRYLTSLLLLAVTTLTWAYSFAVDGIYYDKNSDGTSVTVTYKNYIYYNSYSGSVVIPSTVTYSGKTYSVTSIGSSAFKECTGLKSVTIPNSVTSIGEDAFHDCTGLKSVTIPNSVTSIGSGAFYGTAWYNNQPNGMVYAGKVAYEYKGTMPSGTEIVIKDGTLGIAVSAFSGCSGLTSVTIPNSVTSIGYRAFYHCSGLTSVTIPNSVTSIGGSAFYNCSGLTSVTIPNSVTNIGDYAFSYCSGLTSVTIGNSVTTIGYSAFYGCTGLTSVTIPNSVNSIGSNAFYGCKSLTKAEFASIESLCKIKFDDSDSNPLCYAKHLYINGQEVTDMVIPNSITSINDYTFRNCSGLTSVTIPNSVNSIGSNAFYGCKSLTKAEFASIESLCKIKFDDSDSNPLCYAKHLYINGQEVTDVVIPNSITSIKDYAFYGCSGLTSVTIPNSVTYIGWYAFYGCSDLTSVTIPNSVTDIGRYAFNGCSNLTKVTLPDKLSSIGSYAFSSNTKIYVNKGVPAIFAAWRYGIAPYEVSTNTSLASPTLSVSSTQATVTASVSPVHSGLTYKIDGKYNITSRSSNVKYTGLRPGESRTVELVVSAGGDSYTVSKSVTTKALNPSVSLTGSSASSVKVQGGRTAGDAEIISESFTVNGVTKTGHTANFTGLTPNQKYSVEYKALVKYGTSGEKTYLYTAEGEVSTSTLTLTTSQPKVISAGNVIVEAVSNLDDEEENVGFEWRRTDWTDDFASNTGIAYLYEGTMEGYIRNLNTEKLWKVRPYYQSGNGTYYYGQWIGLDPTNTSYFEPTVHTYAKINVTGNKALVSGYVQRGSDAVRKQGFKYWVSESSARVAADAGMDSRALAASAVPSGATTVEAEGRIMEAELSNLSYSTTYSYVAFVTTTEGETFYGKQLTFTTEDAPTGIDSLQADEAEDSATQTVSHDDTAIYDLHGRRLHEKPAHGFYIQGGKKYFVK